MIHVLSTLVWQFIVSHWVNQNNLYRFDIWRPVTMPKLLCNIMRPTIELGCDHHSHASSLSRTCMRSKVHLKLAIWWHQSRVVAANWSYSWSWRITHKCFGRPFGYLQHFSVLLSDHLLLHFTVCVDTTQEHALNT